LAIAFQAFLAGVIVGVVGALWLRKRLKPEMLLKWFGDGLFSDKKKRNGR